MDRTATQQAGIAAQAVNEVNGRMYASLYRDADDVTRARDAYEVTASTKLLAQRLTLTCTHLRSLLAQWHSEGKLVTGDSVDTAAQVDAFDEAMTQATRAARDLYAALGRGTDAMGPIGWHATPSPKVTP